MECGAAVNGTAPPPWDQTQVYGAGQPLPSPESSPLQSPRTETFAALPAEPFYPSLPGAEMAVSPPAEPPHPQWQSPDAVVSPLPSLPPPALPPPPVIPAYDPFAESVNPSPRPVAARSLLPFMIAGVVALLAVAGLITLLVKSRANKLPMVQSIIATPSNIHVGDKVTLTAQASDPNNDPLSYQWSDGAGRALGDGPSIIYDTSGVDAGSGLANVQIQVIVSDPRGGTASASQIITVLPAVAAITNPTMPATALPMAVTLDSDQRSVRAGEAVVFTAQVQTRDPSELTFNWKTTAGALQANGRTASLQTSSVQVSGNARQVSVTVMVSDRGGATESASQMISVVSDAPANWPPSLRLRASRLTVPQGEAVDIVADASDRDGDALSYAWRSSSGQLVGGNARVTLQTALSDLGAVEVTATVTDARGEAVSQSLTINVMPRPNHPPVIAALTWSVSRIRTGTTVYIRARASDPDEDALNYAWESSAGTIRGNGSTATLDTSAISTDSVTVTLTVSDARGGAARDSATVAVMPPDRGNGGSEPDPPSVQQPGLLHGLLQREDADSFVVTVQGRPGTPQTSSDAIEIVVQPDGSVNARGYLPATVTMITFGAKENIRDPALVEPPGPSNGYGRLRVRLRPKSKDKPMRVIVFWTRR